MQIVAVEQHFLGGFGRFVHHHFAQRPAGFGLIGLRRAVVDADRFLDDRKLLPRQAEHAGDFFGRGRAAQLFGQSGAGTPPFREQFDHVGRNADRLGGIDQRSLDRLLDPIAGVGAEARAHGRVESFDRAQQAEVAFFDQVLQAQPFAGVAAGDIHHQPQIGAHHAIAGLDVAVADGNGQLVLLSGIEQRGFVDLAEIGFQRRSERRTRGGVA